MIGSWIGEPLGVVEGDTELSVIGQFEVGLFMTGPSTQSSVKEKKSFQFTFQYQQKYFFLLS